MILPEGEFYLYRHVRLDINQVFYIGIGKKGKKRAGYGQTYYRAFEVSNRTDFWKRTVNKGKYKVEILFESDDYSFIKEKEIELIKLYGRKDLGLGTLVNMTDGGEGVSNRVVSKETKDKISKGHKGKIYSEERKKLCKNSITQWSEERRIKHNEFYKLNNRNNTGKCKIINQYDLNGNFIKTWPSSMEIERVLGINHSRILEACKRKNNKFLNFIWTCQ